MHQLDHFGHQIGVCYKRAMLTVLSTWSTLFSIQFFICCSNRRDFTWRRWDTSIYCRNATTCRGNSRPPLQTLYLSRVICICVLTGLYGAHEVKLRHDRQHAHDARRHGHRHRHAELRLHHHRLEKRPPEGGRRVRVRLLTGGRHRRGHVRGQLLLVFQLVNKCGMLRNTMKLGQSTIQLVKID